MGLSWPGAAFFPNNRPMATPPISSPPLLWQCGTRTLDLTHRGVIMGILNLTPDSFSDGGAFADPATGVAHALRLVEGGADIIDLGGESTRPGAMPVSEAEELHRVLPVLRALRPQTDALLSIDTSKAEVARQALAEGADIINDVTALRGDPQMPEVVASSTCGVVLMHMLGRPADMQRAPEYADVRATVGEFLEERLRFCLSLGVAAERVCLDPGIGFGKTFAHNRALIVALNRLISPASTPPRPLLLGVSRKSFLAAATERQALGDRLWPGVALTSWGREKGVRIFRVHDVKENLHALRMTEAILSYA